MRKTKSRIYVCHTFYHVYVAALKEMKLVRETPTNAYKKADIALSSVSTDFERLGDRLAKTGIFQATIPFLSGFLTVICGNTTD